MRFDFAALWRDLAASASSSVTTLSAGGSATLAILTVLYLAWPGPNDVPADAVVVTGSVFTPVAMTPTAPAPVTAVRQTAPKKAAPRETAQSEAAQSETAQSEPALSEARFNDDVNVTRAVQRQLKRAHCYQGPVNGVWNVQTRRGMATFTGLVNARLPVDRADPVLLVLLETNQQISCTSGVTSARNDEQKAERRNEVASIAEERSPEKREIPRAAVTTEEAADEVQVKQPRAEDLGYSAEDKRAPNPLSSVQTASTEMGTETGSIGAGEAAALAAAGAAATTHERASRPERRRTARKYKKQPSLAKSVSKGLKSIQRSLNKLF
jgi:hypothetical protein